MKQQTASQAKNQTMPTPLSRSGLLQRKCACGQHTVAGDECAECRKKRLQRKATGHAGPETAPPIVHEVLRSPGQPLDAGTRTFMEERFGQDFSRVQTHTAKSQIAASGLTIGPVNDRFEREADSVAGIIMRKTPLRTSPQPALQTRPDFSQVRVHTGRKAAESAQAVNALAYTVGRDVVFGAGQYVPESNEGKRLLAHELVHVAQQSNNYPAVMRRRRTARPEPTLDFSPAMDNACACLVHVHNDERNAKAVANLLAAECDYNLVQVSPDNNDRPLRPAVRLPNGRRENDPNELFDSDLVEQCEIAIASGCDPLRATCPNADNVSCRFYAQIRECSNAFSIPVVALHNNTFGDTARYRRSLRRGRAPTIGPQLFGSGKTNIYQWCRSPAIKRCVIGDRDHPDHVIWTSNEADFLTLAASPGVNVALQDETFFDTDLSSLFNVLPHLPSVDAAPSAQRYINIETPHRPRRFETNRAVDNFLFVTDILERLGLLCCPEETMTALRQDQVQLGERLSETHSGLGQDEGDTE